MLPLSNHQLASNKLVDIEIVTILFGHHEDNKCTIYDRNKLIDADALLGDAAIRDVLGAEPIERDN